MSAAAEAFVPYARAEQLEEEIVALCAHLNAATYRLLELIVALEEQEPWGYWGLKSCAHWLNWRCGIGLNAAREKVRVAHALTGLPLISEAFRAGVVSFSKVRAMTRVATVENQEYLLMIARYGTAAQVEKLVRLFRGVQRNEEREKALRQHDERTVQFFDDEDGCLVIKARLPPEQGAVVVKALQAAVDSLRAEEPVVEKSVTAVTCPHTHADGTKKLTFAQRRADALGLMAETYLNSGPNPQSSAEHYQVMIHVTAETLFSDDHPGRCEIENGRALPIDTVLRIACDSSLVSIVEDEDGNPLNIGRKTRAVPPAMQRALQARDGGCRFPGCTQERHVDAHHIVHWADGGETNIDNLALLCRHHHRLIHEGGFDLTKNAGGTLVFTRPDGRVIETSPNSPGKGSVNELFALNRRAGLTIDEKTYPIPPGDVMDYDLAISGLVD